MKEMRSRGRDLGKFELRLDANPFLGRSPPPPSQAWKVDRPSKVYESMYCTHTRIVLTAIGRRFT